MTIPLAVVVHGQPIKPRLSCPSPANAPGSTADHLSGNRGLT